MNLLVLLWRCGRKLCLVVCEKAIANNLYWISWEGEYCLSEFHCRVFLKRQCVTELAADGSILVENWCRLTPVRSVLCGESTDITTSTAVLVSLGETRREVDGVTLEEDWSMYRWASLVRGVSIVTTRFGSDTECLEQGLKVLPFWVTVHFSDVYYLFLRSDHNWNWEDL